MRARQAISVMLLLLLTTGCTFWVRIGQPRYSDPPPVDISADAGLTMRSGPRNFTINPGTVQRPPGVEVAEFGIFSISFDSPSPTHVIAAYQPAEEATASGGLAAPSYARLDIVGYEQATSEAHAVPSTQFRIFEADSLADYPAYAEMVARLEQLLSGRPDLAEVPAAEALPYLPPPRAAQALHAQERYIDFVNGAGIGYLTILRQNFSPFVQEELFYTFQGITHSGRYYIMATFPVDVAVDDVLMRAAEVESMDMTNFAVTPVNEYTVQITSALNGLSADEFTPSLTELATIFTSLRIRPE